MESLNSFKLAQEQVEIAGRHLQVDEGVLGDRWTLLFLVTPAILIPTV